MVEKNYKMPLKILGVKKKKIFQTNSQKKKRNTKSFFFFSTLTFQNFKSFQ